MHRSTQRKHRRVVQSFLPRTIHGLLGNFMFNSVPSILRPNQDVIAFCAPCVSYMSANHSVIIDPFRPPPDCREGLICCKTARVLISDFCLFSDSRWYCSAVARSFALKRPETKRADMRLTQECLEIYPAATY